MIIDLNHFIKKGQPVWNELENVLDRFDKIPELKLDTADVQRFHYLYQRTSSDLAKLMDFSARQEVRNYLESLVARAFSIIHETRREQTRFKPLQWLAQTFPQTFRKHIPAFWLALSIMLTGSLFGAVSLTVDREAKTALMPFSHLMDDPGSRVSTEESAAKDRMAGKKSTFASHLISNNIQVSIFALCLGVTWGIGTIIALFSNGVFLGAVIADYMGAGQVTFLIGWLLPHGSIELPAIILAGQAGFVLAGAVTGWARPVSFKTRLRMVTPDIFTLMAGVCLMLIWAGVVEAFLSQYHEPFISYEIKIVFGVIQTMVLISYLCFSGKEKAVKE